MIRVFLDERHEGRTMAREAKETALMFDKNIEVTVVPISHPHLREKWGPLNLWGSEGIGNVEKAEGILVSSYQGGVSYKEAYDALVKEEIQRLVVLHYGAFGYLTFPAHWVRATRYFESSETCPICGSAACECVISTSVVPGEFIYLPWEVAYPHYSSKKFNHLRKVEIYFPEYVCPPDYNFHEPWFVGGDQWKNHGLRQTADNCYEITPHEEIRSWKLSGSTGWDPPQLNIHLRVCGATKIAFHNRLRVTPGGPEADYKSFSEAIISHADFFHFGNGIVTWGSKEGIIKGRVFYDHPA